MQSIVKDMLITRVSNSAGAAQTELDSTALDMQGYDSVIFIVLLGTVTDASVMQAVIKSNPTNSNSGGTTEVSGTSVTASTSSNKVMAVECERPSQRYVYCAFTRTAQNAAVDGILAIQFNSKNMPTAQTILDAVMGGPKA